MKVFDFTNGSKGKELAEIKLAGHVYGHVVVKNGQRYRVTLADSGPAGTNWAWHSGANNGEEITPEQFGVEAICFCIGEMFVQWHPGHPDAVSQWEWAVLGTTEWNRKACKDGVLNVQHLGEAFDNEGENE